MILAVSSPALDLPADVGAIDAKAMRIDRLQAKEVKKSLLTGTDGGGTLAAFWYQGQVRHLKISIGMSNRQIEQNYYYENGQLVLATSKQSFFLWNEDMQKLDPLKIAKSVEDKYYFVTGKLRRWDTSRSAAEVVNQDANFASESETITRQSSFFIQTARDGRDSIDVEQFIKRGTP
jgi:hypothetical protein